MTSPNDVIDGKPDPLLQLLDMWDRLSGDIDRVLTALPGQMSDASERLEVSRKESPRNPWMGRPVFIPR